MTYKIWRKIVVASLILLGDGALASEINSRSDVESVAGSNVVQISSSTFFDESESESQPILSNASTVQAETNLTYQTHAPEADSVTSAMKYYHFNPRAPPAPTKYTT